LIVDKNSFGIWFRNNLIFDESPLPSSIIDRFGKVIFSFLTIEEKIDLSVRVG